MGKITNKLQASNYLKNSYNALKDWQADSLSSQDYGLNQSVRKDNLTNPDVLREIASECNKPLQSASWVATKNKTKYEWGYNSDRHYGVYRAVGNLWLCRDRRIKELSDCEREQIKLYNKLKREYEKEQRHIANKDNGNNVITTEEKERARVRKIAYNLNREYYDRIYECS